MQYKHPARLLVQIAAALTLAVLTSAALRPHPSAAAPAVVADGNDPKGGFGGG